MPTVINSSKTERQKEFAKKWQRSLNYGASKNGSGTFWAVTGFGKTFGTIQQIIKPFLHKDQTRDIIILVARVQHHAHWIASLDTHIKNVENRSRVKVFTVQQLIQNNMRLFTDLLIVDELHKFYGEEYIKYIDGTMIQFVYNLGLTATFIDKRGRHKKVLDKWRPIDRITQAEAIEKGWISQFIEYNLAVEMTNEENAIYTSIIEDMAQSLAKFGKHRWTLAFNCHRGGRHQGVEYDANQWCKNYATSKGWYPTMERSNAIARSWNPGIIRAYAKKAVGKLKERNDFLYNHSSKEQTALSILAKFAKKKAMIFGQSSELADSLAEKYNEAGYGYAVVYHTQLKSRPLKDVNGEYIKYKSGKKKGEPKIFGKTSLKKQALQAFANNTANVLSTVAALDENYDCPDIELGLITGRTSNPNQHIQRGGRIKRLLPKNANAVMIIVNLYTKGTKDYDWLRAAQKDSEHHIKWISDIDDINYEVVDQDTFSLDDI